MRDYMMMTENLILPEPESFDEGVVEEAAPAPMANAIILEDLRDLVFKLRAFMESREGDLGLGIELGMQRAAEMIENLLARHSQGE
jgi:hypothetical protein